MTLPKLICMPDIQEDGPLAVLQHPQGFLGRGLPDRPPELFQLFSGGRGYLPAFDVSILAVSSRSFPSAIAPRNIEGVPILLPAREAARHGKDVLKPQLPESPGGKQ